MPHPAGAHEAVCRLLPLCLLHHSPEVRRAAVSSCQAVVAAAPDLMAPLLAGLRHWANNTGDALVLAVSTGLFLVRGGGDWGRVQGVHALLMAVGPATGDMQGRRWCSG